MNTIIFYDVVDYGREVEISNPFVEGNIIIFKINESIHLFNIESRAVEYTFTLENSDIMGLYNNKIYFSRDGYISRCDLDGQNIITYEQTYGVIFLTIGS